MSRIRITIATVIVLSVVAAGSFTASGAGANSSNLESPAAAILSASRTFDRASFAGLAGQQKVQTLSLAIARRNHTASALPHGSVVIAGGESKDGPIGEIELIESASESSSVISKLEVARTGHTATLLPDGRILIVGGTNRSNALKSTEIFDPPS